MIDAGSRGRWLISLVALPAILCLGAPSASAQTDTERAGARAAATEGAKAFADGKYEKALDLFTRAESLVHAPPHLLYIARSSEKLGQLVKAREAYLKITREKLPPNAPDAFKQAHAEAEQELAALEPRVPYLTITLSGPGADAATVLMDGKDVPKALVGVPHPVDPGAHEIQATGKDVKSEPQKISIEEGAKKSVELALVTAPGATVSPTTVTTTEEAPRDPGPAKGGNDGMRIGGYVALGVGVLGVGAGTFFALRSSSKRSEADDLCNLPGGGCPADKADEIKSLDDDADSASTMATVSFIVGGVGIAGGITLLLLSSGDSSTGKPGIQPWVGLGSAGVSGRF